MIDSAKDYPISTILKTDTSVRYEIPKFQRKYTWSHDDWEALFDDICFNDKGHFLGSIICINTTRDSSADEQCLDLVDGQQRLTTISLLYSAIHEWLTKRASSLDDDGQDDLRDVKRRLVLRKSSHIRVSPSYHGNNLADYRAVLCKCGVLEDVETPANAGNRKMFKAYRYFRDRLEEVDDQGQPLFDVEKALEFLECLNNAIVVKIEVSTHADAYTLFESLNNRGVPLSAIDLIKNKLLSVLERNEIGTLDENFEHWNALLENLTDNYAVQERFLRQFYNAFRHRPDIAVEKVPLATRSKIILVYQTLIDRAPEAIFKELRRCARLYARLIQPNHEDNPSSLTAALLQLERIGGAPSYAFLLQLLTRDVPTEDLVRIVRLLVCFFVKRNVTDQPPTRDLDRLFMDLVETTASGANFAEIAQFIRNRSADEARFRQDLSGDMYENNAGATRFVLCALEESQQTKETFTDLWRRDDKDKFVWTIEHVFPQGENIPEPWVDMIANGDREQANQYREQYVHKLGNLTITGFNNQLGTMSFEKKRDRKDRQGKVWGYRNGLAINRDLATAETWNIQKIEQRTAQMINDICSLFDYDRIGAED